MEGNIIVQLSSFSVYYKTNILRLTSTYALQNIVWSNTVYTVKVR